MLTKIRPLSSMLIATLVAVLVTACDTTGTESPPPDPAPAPAITSVSPQAALPGVLITVAGQNFGAADTPGTALIGEAQAPVISWTEQEILLVVPNSAVPGRQALTLTTADGKQATSGLLVGVEFTGQGSDLPEFLAALALGTHVLLPAGPLDLQGREIDLVGLHLYGALGDEATSLQSPTIAVHVGVAASSGLVDLGIEDGNLYFARAAGAPELGGEGWIATEFSLINVDLTGSAFGDVNTGEAALIVPDLRVLNSRIHVTGTLGLTGFPDTTLAQSEVSGQWVVIDAPSGEVTVQESEVSGRSLELTAITDLTVEDSQLIANSSSISLQLGTEVPGPPTVSAPILRVSGSIIETFPQEPGTEGLPDITITALSGNLVLENNQRVFAARGLSLNTSGASTVSITGNQLLAAGHPDFPLKEAPEYGKLTLFLFSDGPFEATLTGNRFQGLGSFDTYIGSLPNGAGPDLEGESSLVFSNNELELNQTYGAGAYATLYTYSSGLLRCDYSGNDVALTAPELTFYSYSCLPPTGAVLANESEFSSNVISGDSVTGTFAIGLAGTGSANLVDNVIRTPAAMQLNTSGWASNIEGNDLTAASVGLHGYGGTGPVRFATNVVRPHSESAGGLLIKPGGQIEVAGNEFGLLAGSTPGGIAIQVEAEQNTNLNIQNNLFSNFHQAVQASSLETSITGQITNNVFDFEIAAPYHAASFLTNGQIALDLSSNRWGQLQSIEALEELLNIVAIGEGTVALTLSPIVTE